MKQNEDKDKEVICVRLGVLPLSSRRWPETNACYRTSYRISFLTFSNYSAFQKLGERRFHQTHRLSPRDQLEIRIRIRDIGSNTSLRVYWGTAVFRENQRPSHNPCRIAEWTDLIGSLAVIALPIVTLARQSCECPWACGDTDCCCVFFVSRAAFLP